MMLIPTESTGEYVPISATTRMPYSSSDMENSAFERIEAPNLIDDYSSPLNRICIASVGVFLGAVTLVPNIMMSDSGSARARRSANLGILASGLFVVGGILGGLTSKWKCLIPGLVFQVIAFISMG